MFLDANGGVREGGGKGKGKHRIPHANFKRLINKNAIIITPKIGPPAIFTESLEPLGFWQKLGLLFPVVFSTRVHLCVCFLQFK
jgi:hypothetical protein